VHKQSLRGKTGQSFETEAFAAFNVNLAVCQILTCIIIMAEVTVILVNAHQIYAEDGCTATVLE